MQRKIIMAGFGGQGVLAMGQMLTYAGMIENFHVSWMPSYGPEMRGGSANCSVIISDEPIGAPNITVATDVVAMNQPSLDKFASYVKEGGNLFINTSLVNHYEEYEGINVYKINSTNIAKDMGNAKMANMVMLGAFLEVTNLVKIESILEAFTKVFGDKKAKLIPINEKALERGMEELHSHSDSVEKVEYKRTPASFANMNVGVSKVELNYDESIFEDDIKMVEFAIESEQEGINFYKLMAEKFKDQHDGKIFEALAEQEVEHINFLDYVLRHLKGEEVEVKTLEKPEGEDLDWSEIAGEDSMIISSFAVGMGLESDAINYYKKACENAKDEKAKKLFDELIFWEEYHYDQLKGQHDLYRDRWWADQSFSRM
jgi:2-oxoacid:acceptor oxidoreductase gamma subunit (pyruvate/2-ketoisovalerate family)